MLFFWPELFPSEYNVDAELDEDPLTAAAAACAAAATAGVSLTQRGTSDTLVLSTATGAHGGVLPEGTRMCSPGTSSVFYMATRQAKSVEQALLNRGMPADTPFRLAVNVSKQNEVIYEGVLKDLQQTVTANGVDGCAVIMITWPMSVADAAGRSPVMPLALVSQSA